MEFPVNVFEEVDIQKFYKRKKKEVSEDYIGENLILLNWCVFKPVVDTGTDLVIFKSVCPKGHTKLNETLNGQCPVCNENGIIIWRFLQVKTRSLKRNGSNKDFFGFTLKTKDFRTDPRHIFVLYNDTTNSVLFIPVGDYLGFFDWMRHQRKNRNEFYVNNFGSNDFRVGNKKINSLFFDSSGWHYTAQRRDRFNWNRFVNLEGLKILQNCEIDLNLEEEITRISILKSELFYDINPPKEVAFTFIDLKNQIRENSESNATRETVVELRRRVTDYFEANASSDVVESSKKYDESYFDEEVEIGDENEEDYL